MIFDDKAKDMIKAILMEKMMEDHPAEINAKIKEGDISLRFSGRCIDILILALEIAEKAAKKAEYHVRIFAECSKQAGIKRILSLKRNLKIYSEIFLKNEI